MKRHDDIATEAAKKTSQEIPGRIAPCRLCKITRTEITCRLHEIDPYDYLVDVLQRVGQHPASRVHELTPRLWKQLFAGHPLRSPLHSLRA